VHHLAKVHAPQTTFNGGIVSKLALGRVDVSRLKFAAEIQTNWMPRVLGPMMLRPGLLYLDTTVNSELTYPLKFVFAHDDTAIIEVAESAIRVRVDDALISRPAVTAALVNSTFADASGWTLTNTAGATSTIGAGALTLYAAAVGSRSVAKQALTINQVGTEHALRIVVAAGAIEFRIGSTDGDDDVFTSSSLGTGTHSLAFTPTVGTV
jgi:hypothetical protein